MKRHAYQRKFALMCYRALLFLLDAPLRSALSVCYPPKVYEGTGGYLVY